VEDCVRLVEGLGLSQLALFSKNFLSKLRVTFQGWLFTVAMPPFDFIRNVMCSLHMTETESEQNVNEVDYP